MNQVNNKPKEDPKQYRDAIKMGADNKAGAPPDDESVTKLLHAVLDAVKEMTISFHLLEDEISYRLDSLETELSISQL